MIYRRSLIGIHNEEMFKYMIECYEHKRVHNIEMF